MVPCSVCGEKHFGPTGPGRCAGDPSTALPPNFKSKTTPRRFERVMALRRGERAQEATDALCDGCDDYNSLEDLSPSHVAATDEPPAPPDEAQVATEAIAPAVSIFETVPDSSPSPYEVMMNDMRETAEQVVEVPTRSNGWGGCGLAHGIPGLSIGQVVVVMLAVAVGMMIGGGGSPTSMAGSPRPDEAGQQAPPGAPPGVEFAHAVTLDMTRRGPPATW